MPARLPESPIEITSTSPTPVIQRNSLPHSTSSPLREMSQSSTSNTRRRVPGEEDDEEAPIPVPAPRRREPFVLMPTGRPRIAAPRHGLALPTATQPVAGPSRAAGGVIDLTEDDDDEIEITGEVHVAQPRREHARERAYAPAADAYAYEQGERWRPRFLEHARVRHEDDEEYIPYDVNAWRDLNRVDRVVEDHGRATQALLDDQERDRQNALATIREQRDQRRADRRRRVEQYHVDNHLPPPPPINDAPPPPPPRNRIGLGGAVLRRGNQQINYGAALPPRRHVPVLDPGEYEQRVQERFRVDRAREAQYANHPAMIAGIVENLMQGDVNRERMEAVLNRLRPAGYVPGVRQQFEEPSVVIARQPAPEPLELPEGFTSNFELNDTIEIDQPRHAKRFMACTHCGDPLYLNDGQKSPSDRIWGLRCGHLVDQKCLLEISAPQAEEDRMNIIRPPPAGLDVLGDETKGGKRTRGYKRKPARKTVNEPVEYEWHCPVKGCGWKHLSVLKEAEWKQDEEEGAVQIYV